MTIANRPIPLADQQHIVFGHVSWDFYERVLEEVGDRPIRVTFDEGRIEIMSPLQEHEWIKKAIARLIELLALELNIELACYGSSTFRREDKQKGLESDEYYYLQNARRVRGMKKFEPDVHPPPDLAIEIDVTSRSIPRRPIYAAIGVPEMWRYDGRRLEVLHLAAAGTYESASASLAFPFLPMAHFEGFVKRMLDEEQMKVLREFRDWVRTLRR